MNRRDTAPLGANISTGGPGSILAQLFRTILFDAGLDTEERFSALIGRYVHRAANLPNASKEMAKRQGLGAELRKTSFTWKTFIRGLDFHGVASLDLCLEICDKQGVWTTHRATRKLSALMNPANNEGEILASLLKSILFDLNISGQAYEDRLERYMTRSKAGVAPSERATIRASINKELMKPRLSWNFFINGLLFVGVCKFKIKLTLVHHRGVVREHELVANIDEISIAKEDE